MDLGVFAKAVFIGFSIAAPVGPIGLLCAQRTLAHGRGVGFASGLGAATADGFYGAMGAFGVAAVTHVLVALRVPLALAGAGLLGWMGLRLLRSPIPSAATQGAGPVGHLKAFGSVAALTLANPMTILSFAAVFALIGGRSGVEAGSAWLMVLGVFSGSALWWLALSFSVHAVRRRIDGAALRWLHRIAAGLLLLFAIWQVCRVF
jgi:threonine/homoserine/homoserine lactone efflux protein